MSEEPLNLQYQPLLCTKNYRRQCTWHTGTFQDRVLMLIFSYQPAVSVVCKPCLMTMIWIFVGFSSLPSCLDQLWTPASIIASRCWHLFSTIKQLKHEAHHSPPARINLRMHGPIPPLFYMFSLWLLIKFEHDYFYHSCDRWVVCRDGVYSFFVRIPMIISFSNSDRKRRLSVSFNIFVNCTLWWKILVKLK
jgi:hypothetical protein